MNAAIALSIRNRRLIDIATRGAGLLAVAAIPVLLTTSSLRFAINAGGLYEYGFDKYDISLRTGIQRQELSRLAAEMRDYFNNDEEFLNPQTVIYGQERPLFTEREVIHMRDVKGLVQGVYLWQWVTLGYLLAYAGAMAAWLRRASAPLLARRLLWGGGLTLAAIALIGLMSLLGFDTVFLKFHQLFFSNDFWQLNPRIHNLIAMFPQDFFLTATLFVALMAIGQALFIIGVSGGYLLWRHRRRRG